MLKNKCSLLKDETKVTASFQPSKTLRGGAEHPLDRLTQEQIENHNKQPINYTFRKENAKLN